MTKYRKKPVVVDALQLRWDTWGEMCNFITLPWGEDGVHGIESGDNTIRIAIPTLEGVMTGYEGDYIIKGVKGEFYPCREDIFLATYEKIDGE